jgi:MATE family multidrug resistance protein
MGPEPIYVGAQGDGGIAAFVPISIAMGTLTVINTYVSQNLGAGRPERAPAYAWNGLWLALMWWLVLIPYGFALPSIFVALGREPQRAALASSYGQILVFGAVLTISTRALAQFFYGMHRPLIVLIASVSANVLNLGLVYGLVLGHFGLPKLGLPGSAIGTVIATAVELTIPMVVFLGPRLNALYATRSSWRPSLAHMKDLFRLGWPGGLMFGNEMVCWAYFMVTLVGSFGELHSNAGWIAHQWMTLSFMPAVGISVAVTAMVGKCMGMRRPDLAARRAYLGLAVTLVYMGLCALAFIAFRHEMIRVFIPGDATPEEVVIVVSLGARMLIAAAAFQLFDAVAITISAALRGAGDTVVPGIVTVLCAWLCIVLGGNLIVRYAPSLESVGPWVAAASYIASLCIFFAVRFLLGRWKTIRLLEEAEGPGAAAYTVPGAEAAELGRA